MRRKFVKECFLEIADNLFEGFKNKKEIIATIQDVSNCVAFSLQLDEYTDIRDTAQLLVFIRMVF
jgi:hypothetical protein